MELSKKRTYQEFSSCQEPSIVPNTQKERIPEDQEYISFQSNPNSNEIKERIIILMNSPNTPKCYEVNNITNNYLGNKLFI